MSADDLDPPKLAGHGMPLLEIENLHVEIDGKKILKGVDLAVNAQRKKRGEAELSTLQFVKKVRDAAGKLGIDQDMLRRAVNVGFSGGEKSATRFCRWRCSNRGLRCSIAGRRLPCTTRAPRWIFWRRRS
jgi:Fe-S cluster assembly ATPase SufC